MLTLVIYAKEDRDVVTIYIPYLFIQTPIDRKPGKYKIIMKLKRVLVDMPVHMDPGNIVLLWSMKKK